MRECPEEREMVLREVMEEPEEEGYHPVTIATDRGDVACRYYPAQPKRSALAALWVGGAGGGWDTPAKGLYPRLAEELASEGIASLRVRYRQPNALEECTLDVLAGIAYAELQGAQAIALTGHSFGGAVVIQAAAASEAVRTVVTLSTQSFGAKPVATLSPRCSILLVHGTADPVLPSSSSEYVFQLAKEPKEIRLYEGAGHGLDQVADQVHDAVRDWVTAELRKAA